MPSATEALGPAKSKRRAPLGAGFERWNRKLHFYSGLFLLFFMWLFAVTGLVLNHPTWSFAESWSKRTETNSERALTALARMIFAGQAGWRKFGFDLIITCVARNFFDEVFLNRHVVTP